MEEIIYTLDIQGEGTREQIITALSETLASLQNDLIPAAKDRFGIFQDIVEQDQD